MNKNPSSKQKPLTELLKRHYQNQFLPSVIFIESKNNMSSVIMLITLITSLLTAFIIWASVTKVQEMAVSHGEIIPKNGVYTIQNLEGGIISTIHVKNGDEVQAGQLLVQLDATSATAELNELKNKAASLVAPNPQERNNSFESQLESLNRQLDSQQKQFHIYEKALKSGVISESYFLAEKRSLDQLIGQIDLVKSQYLQLQDSIRKQEDRIKHLAIRSPVHGIIHAFQLHRGAVISPAGTVMEVIPLEEELVVESKINPRDIGHITIGDPVRIKVSSFDYSRYGVVNGKLQSISASTFSDRDNTTYYKGIITVENPYVNNQPENRLLPGMSVESDIKTGMHSMLSYLINPIIKVISSTFHER